MKIKDLRVSKTKLVDYLGDVEPAWSPGRTVKSTIGGTEFTDSDCVTICTVDGQNQ